MTYATQDDLLLLRLTAKQLVQLTTDDKEAVDPDAAVVSEALQDASARVESYCRQRYALPLQPSRLVKNATVDIAVYLLSIRRGQAGEKTSTYIRYVETISFLKEVASGKASLDQPDAPQAEQTGSGDVVVTAIPQVFSGCILGDI